MSYIFFDLEWNQGYPRNEADKLDEIIQIGAYRLDSWEDRGSAFSAYVRPSIHKKLHHRVKKMLPLDEKDLNRAAPFKQVIREFFHWCGEHPVFFTWGSCDARVLDMNLCWYGMEEYLDLEIHDLQRIYDLFIARTDQQAALRDAVETLELEDQLEYHDAGNDAYYTAMIAAEMAHRLNGLPGEDALQAGEERFRKEKRRQAVETAEKALEELLPRLEPVSEKHCGTYASAEDCLRSRAARVFRCPECENWLCTGNWFQVGGRYVARSRCTEHGRFFSCLTLEPTEDGRVAGSLSVSDEEHFPPEVFHLCKAGGAPYLVSKTPRKRRRCRRKSRA